jgi:DNA polymerase V
VRLPLPVAALAGRLAANHLRAREINAFIDIEARQRATVPLMATSAECGFPSPADDYLDRPLDFNDLLIENPAPTFAVRIAGESMTGVGLYPGDIGGDVRTNQPLGHCRAPMRAIDHLNARFTRSAEFRWRPRSRGRQANLRRRES